MVFSGKVANDTPPERAARFWDKTKGTRIERTEDILDLLLGVGTGDPPGGDLFCNVSVYDGRVVQCGLAIRRSEGCRERRWMTA